MLKKSHSFAYISALTATEGTSTIIPTLISLLNFICSCSNSFLVSSIICFAFLNSSIEEIIGSIIAKFPYILALKIALS